MLKAVIGIQLGKTDFSMKKILYILILFACNLSAQPQFTDVNGLTTRGLVSYWDIGNSLSYSGSGTALTDIKGTNNQTLTSGTTYSSNNWGYINFNGSQEGKSGSSITLGSGNVSMTTLFKSPGSNPSANKAIFSFYYSGTINNSSVIVYLFSDGTIRGFIRDHAGNSINVSSTGSSYGTDGNWHTVTVVRSGTTLYLYIDGSLNNSGTNASLGTLSDANYFWVASNNKTVNSTNAFSGIVSLCAYWNVDLTAQEVSFNYQYLLTRTLH